MAFCVLINCPNLYCLCSVENSAGAFKCFVQEKKKRQPKPQKPLHTNFIFANYKSFRIFQKNFKRIS